MPKSSVFAEKFLWRADFVDAFRSFGFDKEDVPERGALEVPDMIESASENLLLNEVQYKIEETARGVWRRFMYSNGQLFEEFVSHAEVMGLPVLHYTRGKCPETGKGIVAKGIIAIGQRSVGLVAIGQMALGLVAVGQLGVGVLFGFGQATCGFIAVGQLALGALVGLGQLATGYVVVAQFGVGTYVLAQLGYGEYVWDTRQASPTAQQFFRSLMP